MKPIKAWAVMNGAYLPTAQILTGKMIVEIATGPAIFTTKKAAEQWRLRWKNSDDFKVVKVNIIPTP